MPDPRLSEAVEHHQAGRLPEAETLYRAILADDPGHPDVHHRLGDIAFRTGHFEDAARLLHQAVQQQPVDPVAWKNLVDALMKAGYADDAEKVLAEGRRLGLLTVTPNEVPTDPKIGQLSPDALNLTAGSDDGTGQPPDRS